MKCEIHIYGPHSKLTGIYPVDVIKKATSYPVEGHKFSKAFRKGLWDGRKHLFNAKTGAFPTGLVTIVKETLVALGHEVLVEDHRPATAPLGGTFDLAGVSMTGKYDYQLDTCKRMIAAKQGIVKLATNGGKSEIACAVTKYIGRKTLFVVTTRELLYQARARFQKRLAVGDDVVGIVGDGHFSPGSWVTIATLDTLESRMDRAECQQLLAETEVLFIDECHHTGSETWYTVSTLCPAYYRFGLSGTPLDRTDGANLRLIAATGDVIVNISNKFLVDRGVSARANIVWDKITEPVLKKGIQYNTAYKQGVVENPQLLKKVIEWTKLFHEQGLGVLILVEEIQHGKLIDDALWTDTGGAFIPHQFLHGEEDTDVRSTVLRDFANKQLPVLIASTILDEGVDVPVIDALIVAGSRKSKIKTLQRLGRGLRGEKLIVVEFANYCNKYLIEHSLERYDDYKGEECFPLYSSGPDAELITKLWNK